MKHLEEIVQIYKKHPLKITFTYFLLICELVIFGLIPYLMGKSIDALLNNSYQNFYIYISVSVAGLFIGTFRRRFDTRTFIKVWHEKTFNATETLLAKNIEPTKIISRLHLARSYGNFLEHTLPLLIESITNIIVALMMIRIAIGKTSLFILVMVQIIVALQLIFSKWIKKHQVELQKVYETNNDSIVRKNLEEIEENQKKLMKLFVKISDLEASCWRFAELLTIVSEIIIVLTLVQNQFTAGIILSTIMYGREIFNKTNFLMFLFDNVRQMQLFEEFVSGDVD